MGENDKRQTDDNLKAFSDAGVAVVNLMGIEIKIPIYKSPERPTSQDSFYEEKRQQRVSKEPSATTSSDVDEAITAEDIQAFLNDRSAGK